MTPLESITKTDRHSTQILSSFSGERNCHCIRLSLKPQTSLCITGLHVSHVHCSNRWDPHFKGREEWKEGRKEGDLLKRASELQDVTTKSVAKVAAVGVAVVVDGGGGHQDARGKGGGRGRYLSN